MCKETIKVKFCNVIFENELLDMVKLFFHNENIIKQTEPEVNTGVKNTGGRFSCIDTPNTGGRFLCIDKLVKNTGGRFSCIDTLEPSPCIQSSTGTVDTVEPSPCITLEPSQEVNTVEPSPCIKQINTLEPSPCIACVDSLFLCCEGSGDLGTDVLYKIIAGFSRVDFSVVVQVSEPNLGYIEFKKRIKRETKRQVYIALTKITGKSMPWGAQTGIRPSKQVHEMMHNGKSELEIKECLTDYYFVSKEKADLIYKVAELESKVLQKALPNGVGLYIGIPFCNTRCLYCSFISDTIDRCRHLVPDYLKALKYEIKAVAELIRSKNLTLESIYMGGGTPTSLDTSSLEDLLKYIEATLNLDRLLEFSLEAGRPDSIDESKLKVIKQSRVDRISINPQTMNDSTLKLIGRNHSAEDIVNAFKLAREIGFDNINMDLIIGLPGEDRAMFEYTLSKIRELDPESLTVHTMAVKKASKLIDEKDKYNMTGGREASEMVNIAYDFATESGMQPYYLYRQKNMLGNLENIGYCKPGFESIYNIQIMDETQTILAVGAGGITKVLYKDENRIERAPNVKNVEEYINRIDEMIARKKALL